MATLVLTDAFVSINAVDISAYVKSVNLNYSAELLDDTVMGDTTRSRKGGLLDWSVEVEVLQDFVDDGLDEDMFALVGTAFTVIVRPDKSDGVGTGNPNYTGTAILEGWNPISNSVGELATVTFTVQSAGALSRATA